MGRAKRKKERKWATTIRLRGIWTYRRPKTTCVVTRLKRTLVLTSPLELFHAILLRRKGFSRNGLMRFFVPEAQRDIDAAARAPDMRAFIQQKQKEGDAHVAKYDTTPSYGSLFGLAYSPIQVSAFGSLALPSLDFDGSHRHTSFM